MTNDFATVLRQFIEGLDLGLKPRLDYLTRQEDLAIYPMPGGKVNSEYMDGTREISLPFEIAIKTKNQELANNVMWTINSALSNFDLKLPSLNNSYTFTSLDVEKPFLNDLSDQGFYIYVLDITAHLEIERKN
ncbi:TPA: minor capsid protein [Streptococcus pyogenes]|uniref:minor capsid protein n=1 Tax=Streptococcus TaxID=1301 RepID=UPI002B19DEC1|nr:minor capsid protein [Streptococcus pyogenes]HEQ3723046.1 minor capsid protein [Streptococcus pyogenes]HEQ3738202.1 minor capsid protein [Streptococcus pyogenes]HEQ4054359.1 minor capsid protein [Streptococcus pyogenes]HEQ4130968.1 minor capsid protein [Streptococcus pyogenes]